MLAIQPKQNRTSEALASMDKSASQFESVGVSRSCFALANQTR
ncbi:hypothetical protein [Helicobacter pylori]|nr:hypothetical protein [Helicobacter pylori]